MAETQGRGPYWDERRIEQAAKYAHENGGTDSDVRPAAQREFGSTTQDLINRIRDKMRRLFG